MLAIRTLTRLIASNGADGHISCFRKVIAAGFIVRGHGVWMAGTASVWRSSG